jgi:hypothetical protein
MARNVAQRRAPRGGPASAYDAVYFFAVARASVMTSRHAYAAVLCHLGFAFFRRPFFGLRRRERHAARGRAG